MLRFAIAAALLSSTAFARDGFADGRPTVCATAPKTALCSDWIAALRQPDNLEVSCCGEADAFLTDGYEVDALGRVWAIFSEDYPPRPGYDTLGFKKGDKIEIPPNKVVNARQQGGNPSGHSITFIITGTKTVICWVGPTGV